MRALVSASGRKRSQIAVVVHRPLDPPQKKPMSAQYTKQSHAETSEPIQPGTKVDSQCLEQPKSGLERTNDSPPTRRASQETSSRASQAHDRQFRVILEPSNPQLLHVTGLSANRNLRRSATGRRWDTQREAQAERGVFAGRLDKSTSVGVPPLSPECDRHSVYHGMNPDKAPRKPSIPERDQDAPQVFLLHGAHEALDDGDAAVAPDRAKPGHGELPCGEQGQ